MNVEEILALSGKRLSWAGIEEWEWESRCITSHIIGIPISQLHTMRDRDFEGIDRVLENMLSRRTDHEPLQLIIGNWDFFGRKFHLEEGVLVPRMETEILVEEAVSRLKVEAGQQRGFEVGSGSGVIGVTLLKEFECLEMTCVDISERAIEVTHHNASHHGVRDRMDLIHCDYKKVDWHNHFHFIISNPPYLSEKEFASAMPEVRLFEPKNALVGGERGLEFMEELLDIAPSLLLPGGYLFLEIGRGQGKEVRNILLRDKRVKGVEILDDLAAIPRVAVARLH